MPAGAVVTMLPHKLLNITLDVHVLSALDMSAFILVRVAAVDDAEGGDDVMVVPVQQPAHLD